MSEPLLSRTQRWQAEALSGHRCPYCCRRTTLNAEGTRAECVPCDAWVRCDRDGKPLGRVADYKLRCARVEAHKVFDRLWQSGYCSRERAYQILASELGLELKDAHFARFGLDTCRLAIQKIEARLAVNKPAKPKLAPRQVPCPA